MTQALTQTLTSILLRVPADLLAEIDRRRPAGQTRSEWIREALRQRLDQQT